MSQPGAISLPLQRTAEIPFQTYKRSQAALARHRLYRFDRLLHVVFDSRVDYRVCDNAHLDRQ